MFCPQCASINDDDAKVCSSCGSAMARAVHAASPAPGADVSGDAEALYKAVLGPRNQDYYLHRFARFDSAGKAGVSWHWPAFFITSYWLLYRKMWVNALIYFFLPYLLFIPLGMATGASGDSADALVGLGYALFIAAFLLLPPMYANAIYYHHCKKKIAQAAVSGYDAQQGLGELSGKGGTSKLAFILVLIFAFIAIIGILAAVAIPVFEEYAAAAR